jgi:hypothetical protein
MMRGAKNSPADGERRKHGGRTLWFDQLSDGFWEQLEKKYSLVIEGNKATASVGGMRVIEVTGILGTDDANVLIDFGFDPSTTVSNMGIKAPQKFTDSNLAAELKQTCLFILAQMEMALAAVAAEDN